MAGRIVHVEIPVDDTAAGRAFWGGLFGWEFETSPGCPGTTWRGPPRTRARRSANEPGARGCAPTSTSTTSTPRRLACGSSAARPASRAPCPRWAGTPICKDRQGNEFGLWQHDTSAPAPEGSAPPSSSRPWPTSRPPGTPITRRRSRSTSRAGTRPRPCTRRRPDYGVRAVRGGSRAPQRRRALRPAAPRRRARSRRRAPAVPHRHRHGLAGAARRAHDRPRLLRAAVAEATRLASAAERRRDVRPGQRLRRRRAARARRASTSSSPASGRSAGCPTSVAGPASSTGSCARADGSSCARAIRSCGRSTTSARTG